jgi:site-specific DNA recombinase
LVGVLGGSFILVLCLVERSMKALGYVRCSTDEQALEGVGLEAQRARIASWCDLSGAHVVDVIEDAGISGAVPLADRPNGFRIAALLRSRAPEVDVVVVARLDRLGRDASETLVYLKKFASGKVGLVSIADRLDLPSPQGRAMAQMSAVFGELERNLIAQRTSDALTLLRATGRVYGSIPYAFKEDGGRLVPDQAEQAVLARISVLRDEGTSYAAIADRLNREGVLAKRGGIWHAMSVRSVLRTSARIAVPTTTGAVS